MRLFTEWAGHKLGYCEKGLSYGDKLYLKPMRPSPVLLGFYCGTKSGLRIVQLKNSVDLFEGYAPAFAATSSELERLFY